MVDKLSNAILDYLISSGEGTSYFCSLSDEWDSYSHSPFSQLCDAVKASPDDTIAAVSYLEHKGLVEYRKLKSKYGPVNIAFHLTHPGLHYKEIRSLERRERWKERILGFVSGVLTTLASGIILEWFVG